MSSRERQPAYGWARMSFLLLTNLFLQLLFFHVHARDDIREGKDRKRKNLSLRVLKAEILAYGKEKLEETRSVPHCQKLDIFA